MVAYDPNTDISVLDVPGLQAPALSIAEGAAPNGTDAVILGYPGGGPFEANPARIREVIELNGPDIYRTTTVSREVYVIRGRVQQGDSGGPLIDVNGRVLGIKFGAAVEDPEHRFRVDGRAGLHRGGHGRRYCARRHRRLRQLRLSAAGIGRTSTDS